MGFQERKDRAEKFKQKTDQALDQLKLPGLSSAVPVETNLVFECIKSRPDANLAVGDLVRIIDMRDKIEVFKDMVGVGYVVAADSFRDSVKLSEENGMAVDASVIEVSEISPTFMVKIHRT